VADAHDEQPLPTKTSRLIRLAIVAAIILGLNLIGTWIGHRINFQLFPRHDAMLHVMVITSATLYILLMAIPFMPGIEIGMALMLLLGYKSALLVYLCTLIALSISFAVGKYFPLRLVRRLLTWLYLYKASELVAQLEPLDRQERLALLHRKAPARITPFLLRHKYLTIIVMLNLPGNALIGGGGGIGLMVGMSHLIPFHKFFIVTAAAILPVPLLVYLQGVIAA